MTQERNSRTRTTQNSLVTRCLFFCAPTLTSNSAAAAIQERSQMDMMIDDTIQANRSSTNQFIACDDARSFANHGEICSPTYIRRPKITPPSQKTNSKWQLDPLVLQSDAVTLSTFKDRKVTADHAWMHTICWRWTRTSNRGLSMCAHHSSGALVTW